MKKEPKSPETRLILFLLTKNVKTLQDGVDLIIDMANQMIEVRRELQEYRNAVRSARDANPHWTDEQVDLMIIDSINEKRGKAGAKLI